VQQEMFNRNVSTETKELPAAEADYADVGWWVAPQPDLPAVLSRLAPISLDEMAGVALLDRSETKFVFHERRLPEVLNALLAEYRVLEINGNRLNHYRTLYFDTPDFALFRRHQAGGRNRYKVRSRTYLDTDVSFLEVKHKVNESRTIKNRVRTQDFVEQLSPKSARFLDTTLPQNQWELEPKLWNQYTRITLVGKHRPERVTIDLNLQFIDNDGQTMTLPGLVIAEVKKSGADHDSSFTRHMRAMSIRPTGFSKYCVGVSMLYDEVKHNSFKPKLRMISKLIHGEEYYV
jgi:hypothetical protein